MKEVYLLWESYVLKQLIPIGVLTQLNNQYLFKYFETAKQAADQGCFLPFPYTSDVLYFDALPDFFEQRILKGEFNSYKFNLKKLDNKLDYLVYGDSIKNSDNFKIVDEKKYKKLVK